ncbi:MAG: hydrogen peroxide-inducible genes activator [Salaquimonas sp.]|jgi:LysR family hydrogen peroxide-inducible transcriptional activator|nr:hydrogen peroxide-inducible genes activator [Salaquimonas sp.]
MTSLKQLRYFDAVARHGHFGRAAEHCAVSQPALSMQIRDLEQELGLKLFERLARGIRLTPEGREVEKRVARILSDIRDLDDYAKQRGAPLSGPLNLGVIPSLAPYVLPPLLPLLQRRFGELDLSIRETQTQHLVDELIEGRLDLLLLALPVEHAEIETLALFEDCFLLAYPPDRKIDKDVLATPELLKSDRLLLLEEGHCLRDQALALCELRQTDHINTFGASSLSTIVQMVANGMGMTLLPEIAVDLETRHQRVGLKRFAEPQPFRSIGLAWRRRSPRKPDFMALGSLIGEMSGIENSGAGITGAGVEAELESA